VLTRSPSAAERRSNQVHESPSRPAGRSFFARSHKICQAVSIAQIDRSSMDYSLSAEDLNIERALKALLGHIVTSTPSTDQGGASTNP
jgi:hypothetical protein